VKITQHVAQLIYATNGGGTLRSRARCAGRSKRCSTPRRDCRKSIARRSTRRRAGRGCLTVWKGHVARSVRNVDRRKEVQQGSLRAGCRSPRRHVRGRHRRGCRPTRDTRGRARAACASSDRRARLDR
jgi:hypothetical protein